MNILHLNTFDSGGAATAVYRFHLALKERGYNSKILVYKKEALRDDDVIGFKLNGAGRLRHYFNEARRRMLFRKTKKAYHFFNTDESIGLPLKYFLNNLPFTPDIICVHWVSGFVNARSIYELSKATRAPVVWRFNDMNAFTGGCHYNNGCIHYFTGCGNCPALPAPSEKDLSWKNMRAKINWLGKTNICFVSSTSEIDDELRNSALAKVCKTRKIMLACNAHYFMPGNKNNAATDLGLPENRKIIFFGAQNMNDPRKGFKELLEALYHLRSIVPAVLAEKILLVYASKESIETIDFPFQHIRLPFLQGEAQLAKAYQAATVFVSPSIEDAGPMMIAEAMLCGTPVVAFAIGLAKDAVVNNVSGFIIDRYDTTSFAKRLFNILNLDEQQYHDLSKSTSALATQLFSVDREMEEIKNLFSDLRASTE